MEVQLLEHLPVGIGQAGDGVGDHHRGGDPIGVVGCCVTLLGVEVEGSGDLCGTGPDGADPVDDDVSGHDQEPAAEGGVTGREDLRVAPRAQERLLGDVGCGGMVTVEQPPGVAGHRAPVLFVHGAEQHLIRRLVAPCRGRSAGGALGIVHLLHSPASRAMSAGSGGALVPARRLEDHAPLSGGIQANRPRSAFGLCGGGRVVGGRGG